MILGIDYGEKRIGVAVGEPSVGMAFAREALAGLGSPQEDAEQVAEYARKEGCKLVLVGLPLLESGEEGEQARVSRSFGEALNEFGIIVEFRDERYTTSAARRALQHLDREKMKKVLDSEAARMMVEEYLRASG